MAGIARNAGLSVSLFAATLMGGSLQSLVAGATMGGLALYTRPWTQGGRIWFDYYAANLSLIEAACHAPAVPTEKDDKGPQPQVPCHATSLCGGRKLRLANGDELDFG